MIKSLVKAIGLEYYKFRNYRPFVVILGLYICCFLLSGLGVKFFLDFLIQQQPDDSFLRHFVNSGIPIFDFVDIWQNLAWMATIFKWIPAFIVIVSVTLEFSQKTIRQNIIDGLSKEEFLFSKLALVLVISVLSAVLLLLLGLFLGFLYSPVKSWFYITQHIGYVGAYGIEVFAFLCFALLFSFLFRRSGVTIIFFLLYTAAIEPILTAILKYHYKWETWYFPMTAINSIVRIPFPKYGLGYVHDQVLLTDVLVALVWTSIFLLLSWWLLRKRDL
jgi:ABC-2 type transport system permease protein